MTDKAREAGMAAAENALDPAMGRTRSGRLGRNAGLVMVRAALDAALAVAESESASLKETLQTEAGLAALVTSRGWPLPEEAAALREKVERLRAVNDLRLLSAGPEKGGQGFRIRLKDPTGAAAMLASTFKRELDRLGAENYYEVQLHDHDGNRYTVTVRREHGKTPHELRAEAEAEADTLRTLLRQAGETLGRLLLTHGCTVADRSENKCSDCDDVDSVRAAIRESGVMG